MCQEATAIRSHRCKRNEFQKSLGVPRASRNPYRVERLKRGKEVSLLGKVTVKYLRLQSGPIAPWLSHTVPQMVDC